MSDDRSIELTGVPETMLWPLHHRASEARRAGGALRDPECLRIYDSIDYDFRRNFGPATGTLGVRARRFDDELRPWIATQRGGVVIELGAGLETQFCRVDDGRVRWFCVDVPESIEVRERFLPETDRCRHVRKSALDFSWFDDIDVSDDDEVFVTAQGLLMYLPGEDVRRLVTEVLDRFSRVTLMFDAIPPWLSRMARQGLRITPYYAAPRMPWGVRAGEVERLLRRWSPNVDTVRVDPFGSSGGPGSQLLEGLVKLPVVNGTVPHIVVVEASSAG